MPQMDSLAPLAAADNHKWGLVEVLRMSLPVSLTMLGRTVTQFVDGLMVSRLGAATLSAQCVGGITAFVPEAFTIGLLAVISTYVSQNLGAGREKRCGQYVWAGLLLVVVLGAMICPWALAARPLFSFMGHAADIQPMEVVYFRYMILAMPVTMSIRVLSSFFIGIHRPSVPLIASVFANILNVALNYVLIFGKLGFPEMGLEGAAIGTVVSWAAQLLILAVVFVSPHFHKRFDTRSAFKAHLSQCRDIIRIGWSEGTRICFDFTTWMIFVTVLIGRFGTAHLTAATAAIRFMSLSFMPTVGISLAVTALVGRHIGRGRPDLARKRTHTAILIAMAYMGMCGLAFLLFRHPMVRLFVSVTPAEAAQGLVAEEIVRIGGKILVCAAVYQIFDALGIVYLGALRGAGDTRWPMFTTLVLSGFLLLGGATAMVLLLPGLGSLGPYIAATGYLMVWGTVMGWRFESGKWRKIDLLGAAP